MLMHVLLCVLLYAALTVARAPTVWGTGKRSDGSNPFDAIQPKISANLSNQFEWPVFFYVVCLLLLMRDAVNILQTSLAWLFVVGRFFHSGVQIWASSIRWRGLVFTLNFLAVLAMWMLFFIEVVLNVPLNAPQ